MAINVLERLVRVYDLQAKHISNNLHIFNVDVDLYLAKAILLNT